MSAAAEHARVDPAEVPAYSIAQAARYLGLSEKTIAYWVAPESGPLVIAPEPRPLTLCFKNIVECHVLRALRVERSLRMSRVRNAVQTLREKWRTRYALADRELSTDDLNIFLEDGGQVFNLSQGGQQAFANLVMPYLERIERDPHSHAPVRFYPLLRVREGAGSALSAPRHIVIDPRVCFGRAVLAGTRISTEVLAGRHWSGERISKLAAQYGRTQEEIKAAIEFEAHRRAA